MSTPANPSEMSRRQQFVATWKMARKTDRWLPLLVIGALLVGAAAGFGVGQLLPFKMFLAPILALVMGSLLALTVFGRRAQSAAFSQMDGKPGSAAAALQMLRRGWKLDPAVGFTKQQDLVHRVVGPPGIVLVGEGSAARTRQLLVNERRKHERVISDVPIFEVVCGHGEGEVPLAKLNRHVMKLGRNVKGPQMTDLLSRLRALDVQRGPAPLPKGPMPTNMKGARQAMRGR